MPAAHPSPLPGVIEIAPDGDPSGMDPALPPPATLEMRVNGAGGTAEAVGAAVRAMATAMGLHAERATRFRLVVEELVREARTRERVSEGDDVTVCVHSEPGRFHVEVADLALPISAAESRRSASRKLAALGFVDELHLGSKGRAGNVATCSVRTGGDDRGGFDDEILGPSVPDATDEEAAALIVRPMVAADAVGLSRCVYRCYGYTYKDPMLYEPRHISEALRNRTMRSVVAVTPDGHVVGHCALFVERHGDPTPEAGKLVVDPRFRGHHLSERLATTRLAIAKDIGLNGFWVEAVTNHASSQKEVLRMGGFEVGLLIGASPADVVMADLANPNHGRRSLLAMYTVLGSGPAEVHVPERHAALFRELAPRLGLDRQVVVAGPSGGPAAPTGPAATEARTTVLPDSGIAHLRVDRLGHDVATRMAHELDGLDAFDLGAVYLDLPLTDPGAGAAVEQLAPLGFCFGAWLPDFTEAGDVIRLQRVGGHPVDVEHIACARPEGEALRDYVIADWHRVRRAGLD